MLGKPVFHTHTALAEGLRELLRRLSERLALSRPLRVYLAGGMAVHLYTGSRVTTDVDAEFGSRIFVPSDLVVDITLEDGARESVHFDTNYNATFALMHEDYLDDAIPLDLGLENIHLHVVSPLDLAVSKIARFAAIDREDIATLVRLGLVSADRHFSQTDRPAAARFRLPPRRFAHPRCHAACASAPSRSCVPTSRPKIVWKGCE